MLETPHSQRSNDVKVMGKRQHRLRASQKQELQHSAKTTHPERPCHAVLLLDGGETPRPKMSLRSDQEYGRTRCSLGRK